MDISKLRPLRGKVLLEVLEEPDQVSGLYLPIESEERYPQAGTILATWPGSDLRIGDIAVVPWEGFEQERTYWQVCYLVIFDAGRFTKLQCDLDIWPVIRETIEKDRRTGELHWIKVKTIDGETLAFTSDEVKNYGIEDIENPTYKLDYVPVVMFREWKDGLLKLFYIVQESQILLTIEE